jgi:hypothetical protein
MDFYLAVFILVLAMSLVAGFTYVKWRDFQEEKKKASSKETACEDGELNDNKFKTNMEEGMNVQKLNKAVDTLKENLGGALLATDIFSANDLQSVAGFNSNPAACAVFGQIINSTNKALKQSGFPVLGRFCLFDLAEGKMVVLIPMGNYIWGMLVDAKQAQLGLLLNVALPQAIDAFEDAIASSK